MLCCSEFETTLIDLISPCESSSDFFGRFGIEYDHLQSFDLIEFWRVMARLAKFDFAIFEAWTLRPVRRTLSPLLLKWSVDV